MSRAPFKLGLVFVAFTFYACAQAPLRAPASRAPASGDEKPEESAKNPCKLFDQKVAELNSGNSRHGTKLGPGDREVLFEQLPGLFGYCLKSEYAFDANAAQKLVADYPDLKEDFAEVCAQVAKDVESDRKQLLHMEPGAKIEPEMLTVAQVKERCKSSGIN